ncbi:MAG: 2-oxoglutarate dehydrogenase E1 component [Gammaproteobacteria bacterium]|nr:2-oxoglutarate dehydrogenase E1 component [Gammaproteobacteria bacterium]
MSGQRRRTKTPRGDTFLNAGNLSFLVDLHERFSRDPDSVDAEWREVLKAIDQAVTKPPATSSAPTVVSAADVPSPALEKQASVLRLINAYRVRGHQQADIDPLRLWAREPVPDLDPAFHELDESDMDVVFNTGSVAAAKQMALADVISLLQQTYCRHIGSEYMHITNTAEKRWIQQRLERVPPLPEFPAQTRIELLKRITAAEGIERYLHTKYVGQKRFSLEGSEGLIPVLDDLVQRAGAMGTKEIVIGMAHRGRLNVLVNILGKSPHELFGEFEGKYRSEDSETDTGDVKYHQGFSSDVSTPGGYVHLALSFNPSHLEIIDPVVEGSVRARQERRRDTKGNLVLPILIHGDAAFAGQGVIMETFNMSQARGFATGGTVHVIINNQIGFTTSNPLDARSTLYCTEVAKIVQAPIFHVNADDPEAVLFVTQIALDYRMQFHKDVVVDLVCYRRHGHNEADEPTVTQPVMYQTIKQHPPTRELYAKQLVSDKVLTQTDADEMVIGYRDALDQGQVVAEHIVDQQKVKYMVDWTPYIGTIWNQSIDTALPLDQLQSLADRMQQLPDEFELHPRVAKIMADRRKMAAGESPADWGFAECLAYASLLKAGYLVRLTGQDSGRGTFFHRHAILHNQKNRQTHIPLKHIGNDPEKFVIINSLLSEEAVLAFEYGYATTEPHALVIWEAQFGDFANGAQVVIDQFISSGEAKWGRLCGLTMFLPHGYEGQGAEHSSARLERYLQLCAEHNMQVCVPTAPAQMFHMLRRQALRAYRRPLVVMTPKSLLRHKLSASPLDRFTGGSFLPVIGEIEKLDDDSIHRVVVCSGKVYFDLLEQRFKRNIKNIALVRVEQLHPFPREALSEQFRRYWHANEVVWCQEEPKNQGAWYQIQHHIKDCLIPTQKLSYAGREASPSPAVGYYKLHLKQQIALIDQALMPTTEAREVTRLDRKISHVN